MRVSKRVLDMIDPEVFEELWLEKVRMGFTYEEAYELLEVEYKLLAEASGLDGILKIPRYASYDSFRISRRKRLKV